MADRPTPLDHLLSRKRPVRKTVTVVLDPELAEDHEEASRAVRVAEVRAEARPSDTEAQAQLWEAQEALRQVEVRLTDEEAVASFTFRSIGRAAYDALVDRFPATAEQRQKAKAQGILDAGGVLGWNPETFPPALVAACLVEPKLSEDEVAAVWASEDWNQAELQTLLGAAIEVNGTRRVVDLKKGLRPTRLSGRS